MGGGATNMIAVMVLVVLAVSWLNLARAGLSAAECHEERRLAVNACKSLIHGGFPSPQCCQRARVSHAECICPDVTPELVAMIGDINRAIRLVERCGRRVPHHFKCGIATFIVTPVVAKSGCGRSRERPPKTIAAVVVRSSEGKMQGKVWSTIERTRCSRGAGDQSSDDGGGSFERRLWWWLVDG
ncbi:hypothetical protein E3N88_26864 [Mikania micrantha]|uniref:Bifunctional inhibitor/plant lipid transfer protein/seed storage helical domain-containing protein n=1 Tax=Mikania micrantha TaxID=192012 RepID=A0A5N6MV15_9ASTR|nr:hypothetical protein E3N88_26864 [Mikania micrantha]